MRRFGSRAVLGGQVLLVTLALFASRPAIGQTGNDSSASGAASSVGVKISEADDYTQWKQALNAERGTDPASFRIADGFQIELLHSAAEAEGSWVSMAIDPRGRIIVAKEERGLLRITLPQQSGDKSLVETIDDTLLECRGLLFAHDSLYANANNSKGLYRLRDTDGDDQFDESTLLYRSAGGAGHGRNDLALGPDGMIYSIHGDSVDLPTEFFDATSPLSEHRQGQLTREGHVLRFDRDGQKAEVFATGLRNPFGIDFNADGELFTYDADAEFDMGSPWYRPTRIVHVVRGGDFGWRGVTGNWPPYYPDHPDNALPAMDIGKGSPTAVKFGTRSNFPSRYRRALFALDWAYGRIVAVHLKPSGAGYSGAGYTGTAETFLQGRPLNVTDLDFGPDGAMYFVTGGRKTKSGLYRVRFVGGASQDDRAEATAEADQAGDAAARQARQLRRRLESLCEGDDAERALAEAWPELDHADPWIRYAARNAVEHQPLDAWRERALDETHPRRAVAALLALVRSPEADDLVAAASRVAELNLFELDEDRLEMATYVVERALAGEAGLQPSTNTALAERFGRLFPHAEARLNRRLSSVLIGLKSPDAIERTLQLLATTDDQTDQMHYLFVLRECREMNAEQRARYAATLGRMRQYQGGEGMPKFQRQLQNDWLATLTGDERARWQTMLAAEEPATLPPIEPRPEVRKWQAADLVGALDDVSQGRDLRRGQQMFAAALCVRCHRVGFTGAAIGPDLTFVARRFGRRDLLESILDPSKVVAEQYRTVRIVTVDGRVLSGQVLPASDYRSPKLRIAANAEDPADITELDKQQIETYETSLLSPMPQGLLNSLTRDEILDLLAFLESGGLAGVQK
ncbi:MAG: PQQ-dependent sugar dehydrogenase [Planctomycetales bacterium]|nr:PQQ-dependent sugar dehydrogenase [Planctomycetales bacterium]